MEEETAAVEPTVTGLNQEPNANNLEEPMSPTQVAEEPPEQASSEPNQIEDVTPPAVLESMELEQVPAERSTVNEEAEISTIATPGVPAANLEVTVSAEAATAEATATSNLNASSSDNAGNASIIPIDSALKDDNE